MTTLNYNEKDFQKKLQKISLNTSMLFMIISQGAIKYSRY